MVAREYSQGAPLPPLKTMKTKEELREYHRIYRLNNLEKIRERQKLCSRKWREDNRKYFVIKQREYTKKFRLLHPDYRDDYKKSNRHKLRAQDAVQKAVKKGKIVPKPCEVARELIH